MLRLWRVLGIIIRFGSVPAPQIAFALTWVACLGAYTWFLSTQKSSRRYGRLADYFGVSTKEQEKSPKEMREMKTRRRKERRQGQKFDWEVEDRAEIDIRSSASSMFDSGGKRGKSVGYGSGVQLTDSPQDTFRRMSGRPSI